MLLGYGKTSFVELFLRFPGGRMATEQDVLDNHDKDLVVAGISKRIVPNLARARGLNWWSIDTGYMGNHQEKRYLRITKNGWQDTGPVVPRNDSRLRRLRIDRSRIRRGSRILLVPPHPKVCLYYELGDYDAWIHQHLALIKQHTDRDVVIRHRPASRYDRQTSDRFIDVLQQDVNCVVVYNSNCAVESVIHGIPVVALGESATAPLNQDIKDIHHLSELDSDQVEAWLRHLSFRQFNRREIAAGVAWRLLHE